MSHISTVKLTLTDPDAIDAAARACGLRYVRDQQTYRTFGGRTEACDGALVLAGSDRAYEIGLVRVRTNPDGSRVPDPAGREFEIRYDAWNRGGGMMDAVGPECRKLLQEYGIAKTQRIAAARGMAFRRETLPDGSVRCYCTPTTKKWATAGAGRGW